MESSPAGTLAAFDEWLAGLREGRSMPVATQLRVQTVSDDLGGQAKLARLLGVSPSRVSRWIKGEEPDEEHRREIEGIEFVLTRLLAIYDLGTALKWLEGFNAHLGNRQPISLLAHGRVTEVLRAVEAEEGGSYA